MDAATALQAAVDAGRFDASTDAFARKILRAQRGGYATVKQQAWIVKLVEQASQPKPQLPTTQVQGDVRAIFALFEIASSKGLKWPKVHLTADDGTPVVFARAGERSKYAGQVQITDGAGYEVGRYFGRIDETGTLTSAPKMTESVRALVDAFALDPAAVAARYGKQTGACCFCSRKLDTKESVAVGYGPVCAEKYELPWGQV